MRFLALPMQLLQGQKKEAPLDPVGLCMRTDLRDDHLIQEFRRECRIVRKGMEGDLVKVRKGTGLGLLDMQHWVIDGMEALQSNYRLQAPNLSPL